MNKPYLHLNTIEEANEKKNTHDVAYISDIFQGLEHLKIQFYEEMYMYLMIKVGSCF